MKLEIELEDRQYNDILSYCEVNKLDIQAYLCKIIGEKHSINKFGDLNDLLPKVIEESTVSVKKRGRPKKSSGTVEQPSEIATDDFVKTENQPIEIIENKEEAVVKPTVKRKRTLKTL
jgi:hypothetical protein